MDRMLRMRRVMVYCLVGFGLGSHVMWHVTNNSVFASAEVAHDGNVLTNTTFKIQLGYPRSFAVHYRPCLCGSQQGTWLAELQPSFNLSAGSGQRSNKRKAPMTCVAAKLMHEPSA